MCVWRMLTADLIAPSAGGKITTNVLKLFKNVKDNITHKYIFENVNICLATPGCIYVTCTLYKLSLL